MSAQVASENEIGYNKHLFKTNKYFGPKSPFSR